MEIMGHGSERRNEANISSKQFKKNVKNKFEGLTGKSFKEVYTATERAKIYRLLKNIPEENWAEKMNW